MQSYVNKHLDMYLLPNVPGRPGPSEPSEGDTAVDDEQLVSIKDELDVKPEVGLKDMRELLPVGLLDPGDGETSRRSSFARSTSRIMDVVEEEDEE